MHRVAVPLLTLLIVASVQGAAPGRATLAVAAPSTLRPSVSVRVHGNSLLYAFATTDPHVDDLATVASELVRADGTRAQGYGILTEFPTRFDPGWTAVELWFGDHRTRIVPGDVIALSSPWHAQRIIEVPPLAIDVDAEAASIVGRVAPGQPIELAFKVCSTTWRCADVVQGVVGDGEGALALPLAPWLDGGALGTLEGTATLQEDAETEFVATFARASAVLTVGSTEVAGTATAGSWITLTALTTDVRVPRGPGRVGDPQGSSRWTAFLGVDKPLRVRSRLALALQSPMGRAYTMTLAPADLGVDVDRDRGGTVRAPAALAGTAVRITGRSPRTGRRSDVLVADASGAAAYDPTALAPAGGPAVLSHEVVADGVVTRRTAYRPGLRFLLGSGRVSGVLEDASSTTISVRDRAGKTTLEPVVLGASGRYLSREFEGTTFAFGDQVRLDRDDGDPTVVVLPSLEAAYRLPDHALHGIVRPGTRVVVTVRGGSLEAPLVVTAVGDAGGRFVVPLAEHVARGRPLSGTAEVEIAHHHAGYVLWSQPWITYDLGGGFVDLGSLAGYPQAIAIAGSDASASSAKATLLPSAESLDGTVPPVYRASPLGWGLDRADGIRSGDRITVTHAGAAHAWEVPAVGWRIDGPRVVVSTSLALEGAVVCVDDALGSGARCVDAELGPGGTATADLGVPVAQTSRLRAELSGADQRVRAWHISPTIEADLDRGTVRVTGLPDAAGGYALVVRRDGVPAHALDLVRVATGMTGSVPGPLLPGDELVVGGADGSVTVAAVVPDVRVAAVEGARVAGTAEQPDVVHVAVAGGRVLEMVPWLSRETLGQALAVPDADGRFDARLTPERDLTFAAAIALRSVTRAGHAFVQRHMTPALYAASPSRTICGYTGVPHAAAQIVRWDGAAERRHVVESDRLGGFRVEVADRVPITAGNRVTMTAAAATLSLDIPAVRVERELASRGMPVYHSLEGVGPPDTRLHYLDEDVCARIEPQLSWTNERRTEADGGFAQGDTTIAMGAERAFVFDTAHPGAYALRPYVWWGLRVFPERRRIELLMSRWNAATLAVMRRSGGQRVETALRTQDAPFVAYEVPFDGALQPGDAIAIAVDHRQTTLSLPHLAFDWSPGAGIVGTSDDPANTSVALRFADGAQERVAVHHVGPSGFEVTAGEIAAREAARGRSVVGVRATLHHSPLLDVVVDSQDGRVVYGQRAYLPFTTRSRGR